MSVVEFSADGWQTASVGLGTGLARRVERVSELVQGLEALAASGEVRGVGANGMRSYIREVHIPVLRSVLVSLTTFQTAIGVYWDGYAQVDAGGDFRLIKDEHDAHLVQLVSGMETLRGFSDRLRRIAGDASHVVSLGSAGAVQVEHTVACLEGMHRVVKGQAEAWEAYEASEHGFGQVRELNAELGRVVKTLGGLSVGRGRSYRAGSFDLTVDRLGELTVGMVEYCRTQQKAASRGWERLFAEYAADVEEARREKAGWDLIWDGLQIAAGVLVTVIGVGLTPFTGGLSLGLTVLGGALIVGGVNSAINHVSIATTGAELNLIGMAAEQAHHWYDVNVATPAAGSGSWGVQFLAGVGSGALHAITGVAQLNVQDLHDTAISLIRSQDARDQLWNQVTTTVGKVVSGDAYAAGELASVLIPGTAVVKAARTSSRIGNVGGLPSFKPPVISPPNTAAGALDWITGQDGGGVPRVAKDFTPATKLEPSGERPRAADALTGMPGVSVVGGKVLINGIEKMTVEEWGTIYTSSVHNAPSPEVTLGKWEGPTNANSYTNQAIKTGNQYFDLGNEWSAIRTRFGLSEQEMFDLFNRPFLDDIIQEGKTIRFSHDPVGDLGALGDELNYLKKNGYVFFPEVMSARRKW